MAQDLRIANALYNDVPSVSIPTQGGWSASFIDTSDANATAGDISTGKTAYVNGVKLTGTGGGGGSTKYGISIDNLLGNTDANGVLQLPTGGNVDLTISGFTDCVARGMEYKFYDNSALKTVVVQDLTSITGQNAFYYTFYGCLNLTSIEFSDLETVHASNAMYSLCYQCTHLQSASFPKLETVIGTTACAYLLGGGSNVESVNFPVLKIIGDSTSASSEYRQFYYAFNGCTKLESISFPALEHIYCNGISTAYGTFYNNNKVKKFYFPALKTISKTDGYTVNNADVAAQNVFGNCPALTEIHFAAANQTTIEASTGYSTKWGAPSTCTIYFDL